MLKDKYRRECKFCGHPFNTKSLKKDFCNDCIQFHKRERYVKVYKYKKKERKLKEEICPICKKFFLKKNHNHLYCSKECMRKNQQETYMNPNKLELSSQYYKLRFIIMKRDNFTCKYCGRSQIDDNIKIHIDHINPKSRGGEDKIENFIVACEECNLGKADILLEKHQEEKFKKYAKDKSEELNII